MDAARNVILLGESGVGKSSIINLIVGSQVARTSTDVDACTTHPQSYDAVIHGHKYRLWDTPGLDSGTLGRFQVADGDLKTFLQRVLGRNEPSLLLYSFRASRATRALAHHCRSIRSATDESAVPMAIVVTGLEDSQGDMETWWGKNVTALSEHARQFVDHACITSVGDDPDDPLLARTRRTDSQDIVRDLISRNCIPREHAPQYEPQVWLRLLGI